MNTGLIWLLLTGIGLICWRLVSQDGRRIMVFAGYSALMEYVSNNDQWKLLMSGSINHNAELYHLLTPGLFASLAYVYIPTVFSNKLRYYLLAVFGFTLISVGNTLFWDGYRNFPTISASAYGLGGIGLCLGYLLYLLRSAVLERLELDPLFVFSAVGLTYFSASVMFLGAVKYTNYSLAFFNSIYELYRVLTAIFTLTAGVAIFLPGSPRIDEPINPT